MGSVLKILNYALKSINFFSGYNPIHVAYYMYVYRIVNNYDKVIPPWYNYVKIEVAYTKFGYRMKGKLNSATLFLNFNVREFDIFLKGIWSK